MICITLNNQTIQRGGIALFKKVVVGISLSLAVIIGGMNFPAERVNAEQQEKVNFQKIVDFQKQAIPVIEEAFKHQFPKKTKVSDSESVDGYDSEAINDLTDYYFDNKNADKQTIVFVVDKDDRKEMNAIRESKEKY